MKKNYHVFQKFGSLVKTEDGVGTIENIETLREKVRVKIKKGEDTSYKTYSATDVVVIKDAEQEKDDLNVENIEDLKELEKLEKLEELEKKGGENDGI